MKHPQKLNVTIRPLRIAAVLLSAISASAQTTVVEEDFSAVAGDLNGQTPTSGTGTWSAPSYVDTNGSGTTNLIIGSSINTLSFTLAEGNIYELSVDMWGGTPSSNTTSSYAGIGFFSTLSTNSSPYVNQSPDGPWMFLRTQNSTSTAVGDMSLRGQQSVSEQAIDSNFNVTVSRNYKLILNTMNTEAFTLSLFVDNIQYGTTITYSTVDSAALLTDVANVGFTTQTTSSPGVGFDNFKLTVIPEPETFALLAGLSMLIAVSIRRRKNF